MRIQYDAESDTTKILDHHDEWVGDLVTHTRGACGGEWCTIHNPSPQAESIGWLSYRADRGIMERICEHAVGHHDPDELAYWANSPWMTLKDINAQAVHTCDGCCAGAYYHDL